MNKEQSDEMYEILKTFNLQKSIEYHEKYNRSIVSNIYEMMTISTLAGLHKARLFFPKMTEEERAFSRKWLIEHGFSLTT